jgi:hypothetical protein
MPDSLFRRRDERHYPRALYNLTADLFALVQHWQPTVHGAERGRLFEGLLYRYANARRLPLSEKAGARSLRGVRSASGFMHENDAVFAFPDFTVHCELKHLSSELTKNELLIFNQKGVDYLLAECRTLRGLPFYRIVVSGNLVCPAARRFAIQWGISVIEPERLPILLLHDLCGRFVPDVRGIEPEDPDDLWDEVPSLVTPLQHRLLRMSQIIGKSDESLIGEYRTNWAINYGQRVVGDYYWDAMDEHNPVWLEERFEQVIEACGLDVSNRQPRLATKAHLKRKLGLDPTEPEKRALAVVPETVEG